MLCCYCHDNHFYTNGHDSQGIYPFTSYAKISRLQTIDATCMPDVWVIGIKSSRDIGFSDVMVISSLTGVGLKKKLLKASNS